MLRLLPVYATPPPLVNPPSAVMAVYVDDYDATLKKVKIDSHGLLMLQPFNPDYETAVYTPEDQERLNIKPLGLLIEHRQKWV